MGRPYLDPRRKFITETNLDTGVVILERYVVADKSHREPQEGPAVIERYDSGELKAVEYWVRGKLHRQDGPCAIHYAVDGSALEEQFRLVGRLHRDSAEGPAWVIRNNRGVALDEHYMLDHKPYRDPTEGPCRVHRDDNGIVTSEEYTPAGAVRPKAPAGFRRPYRLRRYEA